MYRIYEDSKSNSIIDDEAGAVETDAVGKIIGNSGTVSYESLVDNAPKKEDNSEIFEEEQKNLELFMVDINKQVEEKKKELEPEDEIDYYGDSFFDEVSKRKRNNKIFSDVKKLLDSAKNPYFARMNLRYESTYDRDIYIGEEVIRNSEGTPVVFSWYSEVGNKVYDDYTTKFYINKMKVDLLGKRKIRIRDSQLKDVVETFNYKKSDKPLINMFDNYLNDILMAKKNESSISNIISTIQFHQNQIITSDTSRSLVMQGCAGSGKTMVLFHRIKFILGNNYENKNKICVITPNSDFNKFIRPLLDDLRIDSIPIYSINKFYNNILNFYTNRRWDSLIKGHITSSQNNSIMFKRIRFLNDDYLDPEIVAYYYSDAFLNKVMGLKKIKINSITAVKELEKNINNDGELDVLKGLLGAKELLLIPKYQVIPGVLHKCELYALCIFYYARCKNYKYTNDGFDRTSPIIDGMNYKMLFFDEAQDVHLNEYNLFKSLFSDSYPKFNLFGDINHEILKK